MQLRLLLLVTSIYCLPSLLSAQAIKTSHDFDSKPKLVVGLVIDQMRWDYLYRYREHYGKGGFNRLLAEGFSYENTLIPYTPTYTAPGHSCIYSGSVPAISGIVGNNWFDKKSGKKIYCTEDSTVNSVGSNSKYGKMSPQNMWVGTVGDELRLSNNFKSRVFGIALKDRGAILPAGHSANAAYWFDVTIGKWISSTHYMKSLPAYVDEFNNRDLAGAYMKTSWKPLMPLEKYLQSSVDEREFEDPIPGLNSISFPYDLSLVNENKYEAFKYTPYAATYTFDFAETVIDHERLGTNGVPDFLALSISSTDNAGHHFGPASVEVEDTYLRLDRDIAAFLSFLDNRLGRNNYLFFLTADHGVGYIPGFTKEHNIPGGILSDPQIKDELNKMIQRNYGLSDVVTSVQNSQVYLNMNLLGEHKINKESVTGDVIDLLRQKDFITDVVETSKLSTATIVQPQRERMINGYNEKRSGNLQFLIKPGYSSRRTGAEHGLWYPYDAHIPLLFFGWKIKKGSTNREVYMTDIAPTLSAKLNIQMPNGSVGKVLEEICPDK